MTSSSDLQCLAGNAFNSICMAAAFLVKEGILGHAIYRNFSDQTCSTP